MCTGRFFAIFFQLNDRKARLARIRIAKASSGAAFVSKKKAAEARLAAQESGIELDDNYREEDIFELQHHHLLRCLEKTTDREFVELEYEVHLVVFYLDLESYTITFCRELRMLLKNKKNLTKTKVMLFSKLQNASCPPNIFQNR
ncbi:unnamed protein product [Diabrotica balteata]|uniref:Potassium channel voltage dependent Kv4 C-terminal domain-containing protein n=1 Tax=Diabrotica balteata TaxID=107213 RepID=A0A9N9X863_DIABA|nr:unnamed protein product [Diabrotica balteata]